MTRLFKLSLGAVALIAAPASAQNQTNQPIVFSALVGPGPLTYTGANTGSFSFSTPNGDVDLNRPGSAVLASPEGPPIFFLAPPGAVSDASDDAIDAMLDSSAGILD